MALLVDQYELTMLQAYWREGMTEQAVFSLFSRRLPDKRNFLVACGLDDALRYLERVRFDTEAIEYLSELPEFSDEFLAWLGELRFTGDVFAVAEGTPIFDNEPLLEVVAPLPEAQLAESFIMNQVHFQTVIASKAVRIVNAAQGRKVVDFGLRRMHGADAALKAARAFHIAGVDATSNVLAGRIYGVPIAGTMAHSYIQAHDDEAEAFRAFSDLYPETILLVDTYDTLRGIDKLVDLAAELGEDFRIRGVRLDSGDLGELAKQSRKRLDAAGLAEVSIFASGGLDEFEIAELIRDGAPIDGFGVGTGMGVSADAPALDVAYKLTEYAGKGRLKLSSGKKTLPGRKQVFRIEENGKAIRDMIARKDEDIPGRPLLHPVMRRGRRLNSGGEDLNVARSRLQDELARLPDDHLGVDAPETRYTVEVSDALEEHRRDVVATLRRKRAASVST